MTKEENIKNELEKILPSLVGKVNITRVRRIFATVDYSHLRSMLELANSKLNFTFLCAITGLDEGENLGLIYHLADSNGIVLNLKTALPFAKAVATVTDLFPYADVYEREIVDLLGANVTGLEPGFRYPLTDDWPTDQHPLRKSWHMKEEVK
jgi:NADH:ubiquinone oxidoreductase subunit C